MFPVSEEISRMIDDLVAAAAHLQRGDTLTHEMIREVLGIEPYEFRWHYAVDKARKRIEDERGIATWSTPGVGYLFLSEEDQLNVVPRRRAQQARRRVRKGLASVEALPAAGLSAHNQQVRAKRIAQMQRASRTMAAEVREIAALSAKPAPPARVRPRPLASLKA